MRYEETGVRRKKRPPSVSAQLAQQRRAAIDVGPPSMYTFNIEEVHGYDLPGDRPSEEITAMSARGGGRRLPPLADAAACTSVADAANEIDGGAEEAILHTGVDAAEFFARRGTHTPVKFVYLNRASTGDSFRPYDLVVVRREKVQVEHFTMSAKGVAHTYATSQPSEFVSLASWMTQSRFFNMLKTIRFFRHFRDAKIFRLWRANVRYRLFCDVRRQVATRIFVGREAFCRTLLETNALCHELRTGQSTQLMVPATAVVSSIDAFMAEQAQRRAAATKACEQIIEKLQALLGKVCKDVTTRAKITDAPKESALDPQPAVTLRGKSKSLFAARMEAEEKAAAVRRAQAEAEMLGDFIRLADYMAVSACYALVTETAECFLSSLLSPPGKAGVWVTSVSFAPGEMAFSPDLPHFQEAIAAMLEGMVTTVHAVPRVLYMRQFKPYFLSGRAEGPDAARILRASTRFERVQREAEAVMEEDFTRAAQYAEIFEDYRAIHEFGETWDFDAYSEAQAAATVQDAVATFRDDTAKLNRWYRDLDRMKLFGAERNLQINSKTLKNSLIPVTTRVLDNLRGLLLAVGRDRATASLSEYSSKARDLGEQPRQLADFAGHCETVAQIKAEAEGLHDRCGQVCEMYELLDLLDVKVPAADSVRLDDLKETRAAFDEKVAEAEQEIASKMAGFASSLDKSIATLDEDLMSVLASLHSGDFVNPDADPRLVLEQLQGVSQNLEELSEKGETYKQMQEIFSVPVTDFTQLRDTAAEHAAKLEMWQSFASWNEMQQGWKSADFKQLDVEAVVQEVAAAHKAVYQASKRARKSGAQDLVGSRLQGLMEGFQAALPVLQDLGNRSMQERHWQRIFDRLGEPLPDQVFTLDQLLSYGCLLHADFIAEVSATASGEAGLFQLLSKIKATWAETSFVTINHRDQDDLWILGGVDEVVVSLEDSQVSLQTILASRFVGGIRQEVEEWEIKLGLLSDTLDEWLACQRSWMYLVGPLPLPRIAPSPSHLPVSPPPRPTSPYRPLPVPPPRIAPFPSHLVAISSAALSSFAAPPRRTSFPRRTSKSNCQPRRPSL